jgi:hypothetical protein
MTGWGTLRRLFLCALGSLILVPGAMAGGAAGSGGNVATRPDSRDAPHLFGLGLKEMLADEITHDLRHIRAQAVAEA